MPVPVSPHTKEQALVEARWLKPGGSSIASSCSKLDQYLAATKAKTVRRS
jgi:hypothetical protein